MKYLKKLLAIVLVVGLAISYTPKISVAQEDETKTEAPVTKHEPESSMTKGKDLPAKESGGSKLLWGILGGGVLLGILAALAGGGGSSGGGGNGDSDSYGSLTGTW